jgi:hypothetical protein
VIVCLAQPFSERLDLAHGGFLLHEPVKPVFPCSSALSYLAAHRIEAARELCQRCASQSVFAVEMVLKHPTVAQPYHGTSTDRPS